MAPIEEIKEDKHVQHDTISLSRERRRLRIMKVIFGVFSAVLLLFLVLALILNR